MSNKHPTQKLPDSAAKPTPVQWLVFAALCAMLLWSCRAFCNYGNLWHKLAGKPFIERGRVGSNEWQNFLARAGRTNSQKAYAQTRAQLEDALAQARLQGRDSVNLMLGGRPVAVRSIDDLPSQVADGWVWVMETAEHLPQDAKVYLNFPSSLYYYYGSAFWYPRRVDVNTERIGIRDDATLAQNAKPVEPSQWGRLRELGYTHVVTVTPQGVQLIDLRETKGGSNP